MAEAPRPRPIHGDTDQVLPHFNELRETLQLRLSGEFRRFDDDELRAMLTLQADEHQRGCLMEERVFQGDLAYESSMPRLAGDEERFVLLAMHQTLVERGLCLRQPTTKGNLLVFF